WGLQEVLPEQVAELRAGLPELDLLVRSRDRDPESGEACPILFRRSRWTLDPEVHGTFWLSEDPKTPVSRSWDAALPRIATFARLIEPATGRAIVVFNAHFDHRGPQARLESARLLAHHIWSQQFTDPVVLLGDFNAGPSSAPLRHLLDATTIGFVDAWRSSHPDAAERGTFNGWRDTLGEERIDHLLIAGGL